MEIPDFSLTPPTEISLPSTTTAPVAGPQLRSGERQGQRRAQSPGGEVGPPDEGAARAKGGGGITGSTKQGRG